MRPPRRPSSSTSEISNLTIKARQIHQYTWNELAKVLVFYGVLAAILAGVVLGFAGALHLVFPKEVPWQAWSLLGLLVLGVSGRGIISDLRGPPPKSDDEPPRADRKAVR